MKSAPNIVVTDEQRTVLLRWSRGRSTPVRLMERAKIVAAIPNRDRQGVRSRVAPPCRTASMEAPPPAPLSALACSIRSQAPHVTSAATPQ